MGRARSGWRVHLEKRSGVSRRGAMAAMRAPVPGAEENLRMRSDQEASACMVLAEGHSREAWQAYARVIQFSDRGCLTGSKKRERVVFSVRLCLPGIPHLHHNPLRR